MSDQDPFDCCPGEPFMGDPNGLHTFDCPTCEANMDRLQRLNEKAAAQRDPATEQWREAMAKSTGAQLRETREANHLLAIDYAKAAAECARLRAELRRANDAGLQLVAENRQLRAQLTVRPGGQYHLTDKGLAALAEPTDKEQP